MCSRTNLERLDADFRVVAATQVGGRWQDTDMAGVSGQDGEEVAVGRDGELGDVPWRRQSEDLQCRVSIYATKPGVPLSQCLTL